MVFKSEVRVVERNSEKVCDILSGEMEYWVLNPTDSVVNGFLDGYGCIWGYDIKAERVR